MKFHIDIFHIYLNSLKKLLKNLIVLSVTVAFLLKHLLRETQNFMNLRGKPYENLICDDINIFRSVFCHFVTTIFFFVKKDHVSS